MGPPGFAVLGGAQVLPCGVGEAHADCALDAGFELSVLVTRKRITAAAFAIYFASRLMSSRVFVQAASCFSSWAIFSLSSWSCVASD